MQSSKQPDCLTRKVKIVKLFRDSRGKSEKLFGYIDPQFLTATFLTLFIITRLGEVMIFVVVVLVHIDSILISL